MITLQELARDYINSQHGWAVSEQFNSIYEDCSEENLCEQNYNALKYIEEALTELVDESDVLSDKAVEKLRAMRDDVRNFLAAE